MGCTQLMTPFNDIDPQRKIIITRAVSIVFGIQTIRDWQVEAIHYVLYNEDPLTIINRRTADGKSVVPLTVGAIMRNIVIIMEPFVGLGSNQVDKAIVIVHNVEAYHIDKHRGVHAHTLTKRIDAITDEEWQDTTLI